MSSTNRGGVRAASDYYITPIPAISAFLDTTLQFYPDLLDGRILDPCAGGDADNPMSYPVALERAGAWPENIITLDIRRDSRALHVGDYLEYEPTHSFSLIITNPPFSHSIPITEKALRDSTKYVVMLQRLNWLGSAKRWPFWQANPPSLVVVHHERMSFTGGQTDSIEYAHFLWKKGDTEMTRLMLI